MRIAGRDYVFKLMSPEFVESLFESRRRYFLGGMPSEIGKNKTAFFVAKFRKSELYKDYTLVGEGRIKDVSKIIPVDSDYKFAIQNNWPYVIDFETLTRYEIGISWTQVFPETVMESLNKQRPFGVMLSEGDSKIVQEKLGSSDSKKY